MTTVVLAAVLAAAAQSGSAPLGNPVARAAPQERPVAEGPAGSLPTRPILVTELDDASVEGDLVMVPPVTFVTLGEGRVVQPELDVVNGGAAAIDLRLDARAVAFDEDGAPVVTADAPSESVAVELPASDVHLESGEQATLWPSLTDGQNPRASSVVVALVATSGEAAPTAFIVADPADAQAGVDIGVDVAGGSSPTATVAFEALGAASDLVEGGVQVRWWGGATRVRLPQTLVTPGTSRRRTIDIEAVAPGRYTIAAQVSGRDGRAQRAETVVWLWPQPATGVAALAVVVLLLLGYLLVRRVRRRHLPSPTAVTDEEHLDGG